MRQWQKVQEVPRGVAPVLLELPGIGKAIAVEVFEALLKAAAGTGTALEINASPARLDLSDIHIYRARELGVPLIISTDAHTKAQRTKAFAEHG